MTSVSRPDLRFHRKTATSLLVLALIAGCGGGSGSDAALPTATPVSAIVFTDPQSAVALIETNSDGSGLVAYRDTSGETLRLDVVARDGTLYQMEFSGGEIVSVKFDGYVLARGAANTYLLTEPDGASAILGDPASQQGAMMPRSVQSETIERCTANQTRGDNDPIWRNAASYVCTTVTRAGIFGHVSWDVLEVITDAVGARYDRVRDLLTSARDKLKGFVTTELPPAIDRITTKSRENIGVSTQVITANQPTPGTSVALIRDTESIRNGTAGGGQIDASQIAPASGPAPVPRPEPSPPPVPAPVPDPAPGPGPGPVPVPVPDPVPVPVPGDAVSAFSGSYSVTGSGVTVRFEVSAAGVINTCSSGIMVSCSGSVSVDGAFNVSGNDGGSPVDTSATLQGNIDRSGNVSGTFSGNSVSDGPFSGSLVGSRTSTTSPAPSPTPGPAPGRAFGTIQIKTDGLDIARKVTTTLRQSDQYQHSICGKRFLYAGMAEDAVRAFSCTPGEQVGTGTYIDGSQTGSFVWGYSIADDGSSLKVKTYKAWGDAYHPDDDRTLAVLIYFRYTSGPKANQSYHAITGPQEGSKYTYLSTYYYAAP